MGDNQREIFRNLRELLQNGDYFEFTSKLSELNDINFKDSDGVF